MPAKIDLLYDYYKQTNLTCKKNEEKRNRYFIYIAIEITILLLFPTCSHIIADALDAWLKVNPLEDFSVNLLQTLIWVINIYFLMTYIQINIQIEKTYPKIHKIEKELASKVSKNIDMEGKNYLTEYPAVQHLIYWFYAFIFPFMLSIAGIAKIIMEWYTQASIAYKIVDTVFTIIFVLLSSLYLIFRIRSDRKSSGNGKKKSSVVK